MGQSDLTDYITDYYKRLYASEASAQGTEGAQELCWPSVSLRVTEDTNLFLTQKLTLTEILNAICVVPKGKTPDHDGLPMEFFHECAPDVASNLLSAFATMLKAGDLAFHK
ncbi:unnamed protein product [Sphagnum tenellum]